MKEYLSIKFWQRITSIVTLIVFISTGILTPVGLTHAQEALNLPPAGARISLSQPVTPPMLKGIKVYPNDPLRLDFVLNTGDGSDPDAKRLVRYFLAALTTPEKDLWVNLSPYEKDRIVPNEFGKTEMGRDLLAQDYILKQLTASLIYPEEQIGKKFWERVYALAAQKYGTTDISINTFNKVWVMPDRAVVYENSQSGAAYIIESHLKVMLEQDYLALSKNTDNLNDAQDINNETNASRQVNELGSRMVREIIIPELTKEVNEGRTFTQLRQAYNALILAAWYKKKVKGSLLRQVYIDRNRISGVDIDNPEEKQEIYQQYLDAFKMGAYDYIKDEEDLISHEIIPRKYFSGGIVAKFSDMAMTIVTDKNLIALGDDSNNEKLIVVNLDRAQALKKITREMVIKAMISFHAETTALSNDNQTKKNLRDAVIAEVSQETGRELKEVESFLRKGGLFSGKSLLTEREFQAGLRTLNKADIEVIVENEPLSISDNQLMESVITQILDLLDIQEGTIYQRHDIETFILKEFPPETDPIVSIRKLMEFSDEKIIQLALSFKEAVPAKLWGRVVAQVRNQTGADLGRIEKYLKLKGFSPDALGAEEKFVEFNLKEARQLIKDGEAQDPDDFFSALLIQISDEMPIVNSIDRIREKLQELNLGTPMLVQQERDLLSIDARFIRDFMRGKKIIHLDAHKALDAFVQDVVDLTDVPEDHVRSYLQQTFGMDHDEGINEVHFQRQNAAIEGVLEDLKPKEITEVIRLSLEDNVSDRGILSYVINSLIHNRPKLMKFSNQAAVIAMVRKKLIAMGYGKNSDLIHIRQGSDTGATFQDTDDGIRRVSNEERYASLLDIINEELSNLGQGYPKRAIPSIAELKNIITNSTHFKLAGKNKTVELIAKQATEADPSTGKGSEGQHERDRNERSRKLALFTYYIIARNAGNTGVMDLFLGLYPDKKLEFEKYRVTNTGAMDEIPGEVRSYLSDLVQFFGVDELKRLGFPEKRITSSDVHARKQQIQPTATALVMIYKKLNYGRTVDGKKIRDMVVTQKQWEDFLKTLDSAMNINQEALRGGIDFDPGKLNMQLRNSGDAVNLHFDPAILERFRSTPGLVPVTMNILPMPNLRSFLGVNDLSSIESQKI